MQRWRPAGSLAVCVYWPAVLTVPTGSGIDRAASLAADARQILVLTGAGVSAESGVPTFRGAGGMWREHRPEELATHEAFARDPGLVLEWYGLRRETVWACRPNAAHEAIARACVEGPGIARVVTQNVDGLHARALRQVREEYSGTDVREVSDPCAPIELHGSLFRDRCSRCEYVNHEPGPISANRLEALPRCPACAALMRPDVVWFGEMLNPDVLEAAFEVAAQSDFCLVVGTSAVVEPAASIPRIAVNAGAVLVEVNPDRTPLSDLASERVRAPAALAVPAILEPRAAGG